MNQRQKIILDKFAQQETLEIASLAQELAVSKMTIYRDVNLLQQAGLIIRKHGKISATTKLRGDDPEYCPMCGRRNSLRTGFTLITKEGMKTHLCCPHCGLMAYSRFDETWQSLATDFLYGHVITATQAKYLIKSDVTICCSPSVITFASEQDALKFQKGYGGEIVDFKDAIRYITGNRCPS